MIAATKSAASSEKTACEVLTEARQLLVERGWTRWKLSRGKRLCVQGAIRLASSGDVNGISDSTYEAIDRLEDVIGTFHVAWNDEQTSKAPVLAAFDKAIEACK